MTTPVYLDSRSSELSRPAPGMAVPLLYNAALTTGSPLLLGYLAYRQIWHDAKRAVRVTGPLEPKNQAKARRTKAKQGVAG